MHMCKTMRWRIVNKKRWIISLIFPILMLSCYCILMIKAYNYGEFEFIDFLFSHLSILVSGIIPIILTIKYQVDLSRYLISRIVLFILGIVFGIVSIAGSLLGLYWLVAVPIFIQIVYYSHQEIDTLEKSILLLTNPTFMCIGILIDFFRGWAS